MIENNRTQQPPSSVIKTPTGQYAAHPLHPTLQNIHRIMPSLATILGPACELVLHDFSDVRHSIVAIEGNITGRAVGGPLTDLFLQIIRQEKSPDDLLKYPSYTVSGKELLSSTIFLRNEAEQLIGCLCINHDVSHWKLARDTLNDLCEVLPLDKAQVVEEKETFVQDVEELLMGTINEVISVEQKPIDFMSKEDKTNIVNMLDERGIFLIRGSVQTVARALNVSRYTIYNYLEEVRQGDPRQ